ncbi:L-lactate dehydrogenase (cytochrome) [Panacagrimonas perspica]|uniref:L-lactate dehydrogenase (Cytochrome) n=1 Tax=Panacagrimonas perspica TaxID=381431 RepID=A0A4R7P316_9GAMM|nr:alpha-hydroxy acid oxidase [Panacagrimonas perspica]TDU28027.1 L-lactate dehydrogenase (cytochrome) [Panacagrimonas perspica]THD03450.1 alpha-hydroxy-acid oxidizing enzyme [Panacagrimonas perspica]
MSLQRCFNVRDLRSAAKRRLPAPLFHYIDGGSDDEWTLRRNTEAFDDYVLRPAVLADVANIDLRTSVLGCALDLPFFLSPTGMSKLFHHERELGAARAAAKFGTLYALSAMGTTRIEDVAAATSGPKMFQIYIFKDRALTKEFVERCKASKYDALCLTVDTPLAGNRERDRRTGMVMPPRLTLKSLASFAASPAWAWHFLRDPDFSIANVTHRVNALGKGIGLIDYINQQFDRSLGWKDVEWLRQWWDGPLVIKGVSTPEDARLARDAGATALMISNHGGRQLDGSAAPIECLQPIRDAVGRDLQLIVDGGVRRGTHILKALALGADACSVGRAYLYGLAAGGQAGVERALELLRDELLRDMALLGCTRIADVVPSKVARLPS